MRPLYITYHTGGAYAASAAELESTLCEFALDYDIIERPSRGHWLKNTCQKPEVILDAMRGNPGRPVVWVDADARVVRYPLLFDSLDCDFGCHYLDGHELLSGTLYFGGTEKAQELVGRWIAEAAANDMRIDQRILQSVVESDRSLRIAPIPESYVCIFDRGKVPESEIVIRHLQLSRETFWGKLK